MNRLNHLMQTLEDNLKECCRDDDVEIVLLDYNSKDNMESWVKNAFETMIANGKLIYFKTFDPVSFNHSHSKNLAFKLSNGDIVCNINADHYLGNGFVDYIRKQFNNNSNIVLTPLNIYDDNNDFLIPGDTGGKVCVRKENFIQIKGFDEKMNIYGFEDVDFINRLTFVGVNPFRITEPQFLSFIHHSDVDRHSSNTILAQIENIFIHYITPFVSRILIIYKNGTFEMGDIIDNIVKASFNYKSAYSSKKTFLFAKKSKSWRKGSWSFEEEELKLTFLRSNQTLQLISKNDFLVSRVDQEHYYRANPTLMAEIAAFNYVHFNRTLFLKNKRNKLGIVNHKSFGSGLVYKNFDYSTPIKI